MSSWSEAFHGVQHLRGLKPSSQVSVASRGEFAQCMVWASTERFASEETTHSTAAAARDHGDQRAAAMGLLTGPVSL